MGISWSPIQANEHSPIQCSANCVNQMNKWAIISLLATEQGNGRHAATVESLECYKFGLVSFISSFEPRYSVDHNLKKKKNWSEAQIPTHSYNHITEHVQNS